MSDVHQLLLRVRSLGANLIADDKGLRIINGSKLPKEAHAYITKHKQAIANFLTSNQHSDCEERAAIIEYDGKAPREWAEQFADILIKKRPPGVSELDWSWFLAMCGRIIDEAPERAA
ncbi:hypothetical protein [Mesorhizobium sp. M4B.F.Ca.ET.013.02.1.1]|uniref:hypothetical protein n=2 Tax=unclassified Mesorhizobium TaxID=325217 RepID=UPI000FD2B1DA|nr:hypothetical protein [Mesorhizobium sp. M4B.F.Ca.ET.013.02.1.1]RUW26338.1 hypothetical protein EOA34_08635 [Mesorhizobium sp. M4B.F.Ca.ET.013.02.1.1]